MYIYSSKTSYRCPGNSVCAIESCPVLRAEVQGGPGRPSGEAETWDQPSEIGLEKTASWPCQQESFSPTGTDGISPVLSNEKTDSFPPSAFFLSWKGCSQYSWLWLQGLLQSFGQWVLPRKRKVASVKGLSSPDCKKDCSCFLSLTNSIRLCCRPTRLLHMPPLCGFFRH